MPCRDATFRAVLTVVLGLSTTVGAHAQPAGQNDLDPPARVGRIALLRGTVSFHNQDQDAWERATLNYPVTSGNALWTEPGSTADIDIGPAHLVLDQSTEFDISLLDESTLDATQAQGALFLRLHAVAPGDEYRITTPRGVVVIAQPGAYEVISGDADHATLVTVVEGAARIDSTNASLTLGARQVGRIVGSDSFAVSVGTATFDPFLTARLDEERQQVRRVAVARPAPPPVVLQMTGGAALERVGEWQSSSRYGRIWYPPVRAGWVPYRDGHWGYVAPWGWTWIDNSTWGFAPFHYGRWVQEGPRWGWIAEEPGHDRREPARPVYAPALVSFLNIGVVVTLGSNRAPASVGWIPLGPREVYVPPYHASERYKRAVNVTNVTNITTINRVTTVNTYVNRGAATVVPGVVMTRSQPVAARVERVNPRMLSEARAQHEAPVRPTMATVGVTPGVARQLKLSPPPPAAAGRPTLKPRAAPGPVLQPVASAAPGAAGHAAPDASKRVAPDAVPGVAQHHVGAAVLPALRPVTPAHAPGHEPDARKPNATSSAPGKSGSDKPDARAPEAAHPGAAPAPGRAAAAPSPVPVAPARPDQGAPVPPNAPRKPVDIPAARPVPVPPAHGQPAAPDVQAPGSGKAGSEKPDAHGPGAHRPGAAPAVGHPASSTSPVPANPHEAAPAQSDAPRKPADAPVVRPTPIPPAHVRPPAPAAHTPNPASQADAPPAPGRPVGHPAPASRHPAPAPQTTTPPDSVKGTHEPPQSAPKGKADSTTPARSADEPAKGKDEPGKPSDEPLKRRQ